MIWNLHQIKMMADLRNGPQKVQHPIICFFTREHSRALKLYRIKSKSQESQTASITLNV